MFLAIVPAGFLLQILPIMRRPKVKTLEVFTFYGEPMTFLGEQITTKIRG